MTDLVSSASEATTITITKKTLSGRIGELTVSETVHVYSYTYVEDIYSYYESPWTKTSCSGFIIVLLVSKYSFMKGLILPYSWVQAVF